MKLIINKTILLENLDYVSKALSTRNIIPVLNGIKFELTKDGLKLTASDTDLTIETFIDKKDIKDIKEEGTLIIIGRYLIELIKKLPDEYIKIEDLDGTKAVIETDNSKYNFNCYDTSEFPDIKLEEVSNPIKLNSYAFRDIINQTSFAVSTQESRPLLTGINLKITNDLFECTATDSYRLAKVAFKLPTNSKNVVNIVVPSRSINDFIKLITNESEISLSVHSNKVLFKINNIMFQTSLLNGSYPNTDNLIPKKFEYTIDVDSNNFFNVIDRASLLAQAKEKNIIQMSINNNILKITSQSQEIGKVEEKMECVNETGKDINISFSAKYMLDAIKTVKGSKIQILLNGEIQPIIIKSKDNKNLTQLILPIKTF